MIKLKDLLVEKKLRVLDFDDTLVKTKSFIYITHKDGSKSKLTPGEYAVYNEKPGDDFDFTDFQKVNKPKQIRPFTKYLKKVINDEGIDRVTILTARAAYEPVKKYLKDIGMGDVYIVTLASNDPKKKADWIETQINKGYDDIFFLDDSKKNVDAVKKLQKKYPNIKLNVQQAKETF